MSAALATTSPKPRAREVTHICEDKRLLCPLNCVCVCCASHSSPISADGLHALASWSRRICREQKATEALTRVFQNEKIPLVLYNIFQRLWEWLRGTPLAGTVPVSTGVRIPEADIEIENSTPR
jgi:hypothetical protein